MGLNLASGELKAARWLDPAGMPAAIEIHLHAPGDAAASASRAAKDSQRGTTRRWYDGRFASGWVDVEAKVAEFDLRNEDPLGGFGPDEAYQGAKEAAFAVALEAVTHKGGLMLHACSLRADGQAFVVAGTSGRGKSTLAERFETGCLGDEWAVVVPDPQGRWWHWSWAQWTYRSPDEPWVMPLGGVLGLSTNRSRTATRPMSRSDALALLSTSAFWLSSWAHEELLSRAFSLQSAGTVYELDHCLTTPPEEILAIISRRGPDT